MMDQYEMMLGTKPKEYTSSLEKSDHPESDTTETRQASRYFSI
jgi:hypothetical protein